MTTERLSKDEIFNAAADLVDAAERQAYLDEACAGDPQLRAEIDDLLKRDEEAGSFLESPPPGLAETSVQPLIEKPGTHIGPYKLLQQIGEGGMGVVYMAEQTEPVQRRVALKIMKPGMDSRQVVARFEAERQTLAMMDHPNIAKVLDAGTTQSGRPYFVMELVKGIAITDYCDQNHLTTRDRLRLFASILHGVQHAHQKGIIHRDLKPSNVMVAEYDDRAVPKIIDFGVAKATGHQLTEKTMFTQYGQLVGTLEYMSPEQAKLNQLDVDTRSDIYALGVLLYELLTGSTPHDKQRLRTAAFDEMLRIIREEEPPRPSLRLSTVDTLPAVAANRQIAPEKLSRLVRGELDWIVMKALEKNRSRRYETAASFADDLERYLDGQAVQACPPTLAYRLRKFAQRNKGTLAVVSSLSLALVLVTLVSVSAAAKFRDLARHNAQLAVEKDQALTNVRSVAAEVREQKERAEESAENLRLAKEDAETRAEEARIARNDAIAARERIEVLSARSNYFAALYRWDANPPRVAEARELLNRVPEEHRSFEWHLAKGQFNGSYATLLGHAGPVSSVGVSPDGRRIVSGSADNTLRIWDASTGREERTLKGDFDGVRFVGFSRDGDWIVSHGGDGHIKIWDASTGEELRKFGGHEAGVSCVGFSPDGQRLVSGSWADLGREASITIWDANTADELRTLQGHARGVGIRNVGFSPDGRRVVSSGYDNAIKTWDVDTGEELMSFEGVDFSYGPDGQWMVSVNTDNTLAIRDASTSRKVRSLKGHFGFVNSVAFSPDGQRIVSGGRDNTLRIWDVSTGQALRTLKGHEDDVASVSFSPDGQRIVSGSFDNTIKIWDANTDQGSGILKGHASAIACVSFSPDGERIVSCGTAAWTDDGLVDVRIWDANTGREIAVKRQDFASYVRFGADGKRILSGSLNNTIAIWGADTGEESSVRQGPSGPGVELISADGQRVVSRRYDGSLTIWDANSGRELGTLDAHSGRVSSVGFSPDEQRVVSGGGGVIRIWDANNGQELKLLREHPQVSGVSFSPDGQRVVSGGDDIIKIWDANTGQELATLKGHERLVTCVAFSPDGQRIVSGAWDETIRIWDASTGEELRTLRTRAKRVATVSFSPDGERIVAGGWDNVIEIWDAVKSPPQTQPLLQAKAGVDALWQKDEAETAERDEQWYAATFHWAWVVKSDLEDVEAHERFRACFDELQAKYESTQRNPNPYLPPIVKEVLAMEVPETASQAADEAKGAPDEDSGASDANDLVWPGQWRTTGGEGRLLGSKPVRLRLVQQQAGPLSGKVFYHRSNEGTPDATVSVYAFGTNRLVAETTTDEDGHYRLAALDPGRYEFVVEKDGFLLETGKRTVLKEGGSKFDLAGTRVALAEILVQMPDGTPAQSKRAGEDGVGPETIIFEYFRRELNSDNEDRRCHQWLLPELPAKDLLREGSYTARAVFPHENLISDIITFDIAGSRKVNVSFRLKAVETKP